MTIESMTDQDLFHQRVQVLWDNLEDASFLKKMRTRSWEKYNEIGLPTRTSEVFRYVPIRKFFSKEYHPAKPIKNVEKVPLYPECKGATLVFTNGYFRPDLSQTDHLQGKILVAPLEEATKTYSTFLQNQWDNELSTELDPFAALNGALHPAGLFVYIPPKVAIKQPIEILHIIDTDPLTLLQPRIHLFVGRQSEVSFIRTQRILRGEQIAINSSISIALDEAAEVHYDHSLLDEPATNWHFEAVRATLKRDSRLKTVEATDGAETVRHDYHVSLNGENAEVQLNGVWMLADNRQAHVNIHMNHVAPHCRSFQLFKSAINDAARSSFEGKIYVFPEAQKTEAYQLNNNLLLSDRAIADSKPNLEIFADDVKASHGSTVGQLDDEELFYLRSRGLSDEEARNILIYGFCKEVIDIIQSPSLKAEVTRRAQRYLKKG